MENITDAVLKLFKGQSFQDGVFCGSAFLISDRYVLTCEHVVLDRASGSPIPAQDIFLLGNGAWRDGGIRRVVSMTTFNHRDIAILTLQRPADRGPYLQLGDRVLQTGDKLQLLGCDDSDGARSIQTFGVEVSGYDGNYDLVLTDQTIQHGVSGGPAVFEGSVAGIVQAKEDAHALIIPCSAFREFVRQYAGELTDCSELPAPPPSEIHSPQGHHKGFDPYTDAVPATLVDELVELLLNCNAFREKSSRNQIVHQLPTDVWSMISDLDAPRPHVTAIVRRCLSVPGALNKLIDRIQALEGGSIQFQKVASLVVKLCPGTRHGRDADNGLNNELFVTCDRNSQVVAAREPDRATTLAVILGTQEWPKCGKTKRQECRSAYLGLSRYLSETLNLCSRNMKDLFDSELPPDEQIADVNSFLAQRCNAVASETNKSVADLVVYFVGHGEHMVAHEGYHMYLRCTCNETHQLTRETSLSTLQLRDCLKSHICRLRCHLILDAPNSQLAIQELQMPTYPEIETVQEFARYGLSVLCSSTRVSNSTVGDQLSLNTQAWLEVLKTGIPNKGKRLSFRDLLEPCIANLRMKYSGESYRPLIASPCMINGLEVADVPIFPNPAYLPETPKSDEIAKTIAQERFNKDQPYLLGQKYEGRQQERSDLTKWLEGRHSEFGQSRVFFICDYGGAGKTALVWNWAECSATQHYLTDNGIGYYWTSFYAKNYSWRSFIHNLAKQLNVSPDYQRATEEQWRVYQLDDHTINCVIDRLRQEPWLIILDGIEREMDAYEARGNQLLDSEEQDLRKEIGEVSREEQLFHSPLFARFIRDLLQTKAKVLVTSRHVPEDLRDQDGRWLPGVHEYKFKRMSLEDARKVWELGRVVIDRVQQERFFEAVNYHPQVIGVISSALRASGCPSLEDWFNDLQLTEEERRTLFDPNVQLTTRRHLWIELGTRDILQRGVMARLVLGVIVHQSDATEIGQLKDRLVDPPNSKPLCTSQELHESIELLQSRWLLGVDFASGMVDIHPVIRSQTLKYSRRQSQLLPAEADEEILQIACKVEGSIHSISTQEELDRIASILNRDVIRSLAEVHGYTNTLNLYLGRFYPDRNDETNRFLGSLPRLRYRKQQGLLLFITASMLSELGDWKEAEELYRRAALAYRLVGDYASADDCDRSQDWQVMYGGSLLESERFRLDLLEENRESPEQRDLSCFWLATCMAIRRAPQTRELQTLLPVQKNRWTLQATAEACYYLGESADYQKAENCAEDALRRRENMGLSEELWELLALGMVQLRIGKMTEARGCLQEVIDKGKRYSYPIIPLFAIAGYIEYLVQVSHTKTKYEKEMYLNEALRRYIVYFKDGQHDQYQIPAAEAHLAAARVHLSQGNVELATKLALRALEVARGQSFPFCYKGGEERALNFLAGELEREATDIPPVVPCVNDIEFNQHEERISRVISKLKSAAAQKDSASNGKESP